MTTQGNDSGIGGAAGGAAREAVRGGRRDTGLHLRLAVVIWLWVAFTALFLAAATLFFAKPEAGTTKRRCGQRMASDNVETRTQIMGSSPGFHSCRNKEKQKSRGF